MLQSPYTPSEARNGVIYISFEDNGAILDNAAKDQKEVKVKKEKAAVAALDESLDAVESIGSDNEHSEVVFAEEEEYAQDNEDDFGAANADDE